MHSAQESSSAGSYLSQSDEAGVSAQRVPSPTISVRAVLKFGWPLSVLGLLMGIDSIAQQWFLSLHGIAADTLMGTVKPLGRLAMVTLTAALLWAGGHIARSEKMQRAARSIVVSVALSSMAVMFLKPLFGRMENQSPLQDSHLPPLARRVDARWGRFPSGDSTMAFATASTLAFEFPPAAALFYALAALVCTERVYVGAHLISDTFAGAWLGWAAARAVFRCGFKIALPFRFPFAARQS